MLTFEIKYFKSNYNQNNLVLVLVEEFIVEAMDKMDAVKQSSALLAKWYSKEVCFNCKMEINQLTKE